MIADEREESTDNKPVEKTSREVNIANPVPEIKPEILDQTKDKIKTLAKIDKEKKIELTIAEIEALSDLTRNSGVM
jgi:hypothetical protein